MNVEPPPIDEVAGAQIPGYELLDKIGEGGRGVVFRARQLSLDRIVAIKVLRPDRPDVKGDQALQREARVMASLAHPNLVTIFDSGRADGAGYLVTEFVAGPTLRSRLQPGRPLPAADTSVLVDRIGKALTYIHDQGILHLDLKPENILLTSDDDVKITDFGLALASMDARSLSDLGLAEGTFDYCSPEQRFGLPVDDRSDLFALAVVAYELLTGSLPGRAFESACQLNSALPRAVDDVLRRGLARDPSERLASVEEFRQALTHALRPQTNRKRRLLAASLAGALLTLSLVVALAWFRASAAQDQLATDVAAWLVYDDPESVATEAQLQAHGEKKSHPELVRVQGLAPQGLGSLDLPVWPAPRPVTLVQAPRVTGFVHHFGDVALGRWLLREWTHLFQASTTPPEENLVIAGTFAGECFTTSSTSSMPIWRCGTDSLLGENDVMRIGFPPDRLDNPALLIERKNPASSGLEMVCYQWMPRIPEKAGTVIVLRFTARAEEGNSRIRVTPRLPLFIPHAAQDATARKLRALSEPLPGADAPAHVEARVCTFRDWVQPKDHWQTFIVAWEWPDFCREGAFRNLEITQMGLGKVWLDDVEMFALPTRVSQ